jgi:L-serine dehydratase
MTVGVLDLFRIGIGPSSSHTVGPMRAARRFVSELDTAGRLTNAAGVRIVLYGSLGATGVGHGTIPAVVLGLAGFEPDRTDPDDVAPFLQRATETRSLALLGHHEVDFDLDADLVLEPDETLPAHPNGVTFTTVDAAGAVLEQRSYYSVGGGFVVRDDEFDGPIADDRLPVPHPFTCADDLLARCAASGLGVAELAMENEVARRPEAEVRAALLEIWAAMQSCVERGCRTDGELPGGLGVQRRAAALRRSLEAMGTADPLTALDWVNLWAMAVNEENAAGGRVVTAPTNGAAGIVPAVLHYYRRFVPGSSDDGVVDFLLAAGAVGALFKMNASISGAEVGCQGEVGSACAMAAAGLAQVMGGTPAQVENAAEIALEHNLGLTCDPIGGLVQVPCIERNAMAATKAINAARLALHSDGTHLVSLDDAIATMRDTGRDMHDKYKETARGGLAVTFRTSRGEAIPVPVSIIEC